MRPVNGRFVLTALLLLASNPAAQAAPQDPLLAQIETEDTPAASSLWQAFLGALRGQPLRTGDLTVTVTDTDGHPLAGATVLAGTANGVPFAGNLARTDANGVASFSDASLRIGAVPVTAALDGFTTMSVLDNRANTVRVTLQRHPDERAVGWMRGKLNGIPKLSGGNLELGFFVPAARPETLLNFDINSFVSSYTVKINVFGERDIPGNVVLPQQTKYYGIIPITLNKPDYIMPLAAGTTAHMVGIGGGISISQAVKIVQAKDFLELVNTFSLSTVGWTRDRVTVRGNDNFDVEVNRTVQPNQVTAQISGLPAKLDVVAVSLVDPSGDKGDFVAMDMKSLKSENVQNGGGSLRLGQIRSRRALANSYVFTALFDKTQIQNSASRWVVGSVQPANRSVIAFNKFLSPIQKKAVGSDNRDYRFSSPASAGLGPDLMVVNVVSEKDNPETKGTTRRLLWSAVVQGSTDHVTLPDLGRAVLPAPDTAHGEKFHWEVFGLRTSGNRSKRGGLNLQASLRDLQDVSTLIQAY